MVVVVVVVVVLQSCGRTRATLLFPFFFLDNAYIPPLKVRSITPASDASGQSFELSGRTTITVVFNRAVIALGRSVDFVCYDEP